MKTIVSFLITTLLLGVGVITFLVFHKTPEDILGAIPAEHRLKVSSDKIVDSFDYTEYKKLPNGKTVAIPSKFYIFHKDEVVPPKDGEEISLRTNFSWSKTVGVSKNGGLLGVRHKNRGGECFNPDGSPAEYCIERELNISAGVTLIHMNDGTWTDADYGTTTKEAFDIQFVATSFTRFLPGQTVFAVSTTTYPIPNQFVDGWLETEDTTTPDWATERARTTADAAVNTTAINIRTQCGLTCGARITINRGIMIFPTAPSLASTDTVTAATLTLYGTGTTEDNDQGMAVILQSARNIGATTTIATTDNDAYGNLSPTASQVLASTSISTWNETNGTGNVMTLDADGTAFIEAAADVTGNDAGVVYLMARVSGDADDISPGDNQRNGYPAHSVEASAGQDTDPTLTITAAAPATAIPSIIDSPVLFE